MTLRFLYIMLSTSLLGIQSLEAARARPGSPTPGSRRAPTAAEQQRNLEAAQEASLRLAQEAAEKAYKQFQQLPNPQPADYDRLLRHLRPLVGSVQKWTDLVPGLEKRRDILQGQAYRGRVPRSPASTPPTRPVGPELTAEQKRAMEEVKRSRARSASAEPGRRPAAPATPPAPRRSATPEPAARGRQVPALSYDEQMKIALQQSADEFKQQQIQAQQAAIAAAAQARGGDPKRLAATPPAAPSAAMGSPERAAAVDAIVDPIIEYLERQPLVAATVESIAALKDRASELGFSWPTVITILGTGGKSINDVLNAKIRQRTTSPKLLFDLESIIRPTVAQPAPSPAPRTRLTPSLRQQAEELTKQRRQFRHAIESNNQTLLSQLITSNRALANDPIIETGDMGTGDHPLLFAVKSNADKALIRTLVLQSNLEAIEVALRYARELGYQERNPIILRIMEHRLATAAAQGAHQAAAATTPAAARALAPRATPVPPAPPAPAVPAPGATPAPVAAPVKRFMAPAFPPLPRVPAPVRGGESKLQVGQAAQERKAIADAKAALIARLREDIKPLSADQLTILFNQHAQALKDFSAADQQEIITAIPRSLAGRIQQVQDKFAELNRGKAAPAPAPVAAPVAAAPGVPPAKAIAVTPLAELMRGIRTNDAHLVTTVLRTNPDVVANNIRDRKSQEQHSALGWAIKRGAGLDIIEALRQVSTPEAIAEALKLAETTPTSTAIMKALQESLSSAAAVASPPGIPTSAEVEASRAIMAAAPAPIAAPTPTPAPPKITEEQLKRLEQLQAQPVPTTPAAAQPAGVQADRPSALTALGGIPIPAEEKESKEEKAYVPQAPAKQELINRLVQAAKDGNKEETSRLLTELRTTFKMSFADITSAPYQGRTVQDEITPLPVSIRQLFVAKTPRPRSVPRPEVKAEEEKEEEQKVLPLPTPAVATPPPLPSTPPLPLPVVPATQAIEQAQANVAAAQANLETATQAAAKALADAKKATDDWLNPFINGSEEVKRQAEEASTRAFLEQQKAQAALDEAQTVLRQAASVATPPLPSTPPPLPAVAAPAAPAQETKAIVSIQPLKQREKSNLLDDLFDILEHKTLEELKAFVTANPRLAEIIDQRNEVGVNVTEKINQLVKDEPEKKKELDAKYNYLNDTFNKKLDVLSQKIR